MPSFRDYMAKDIDDVLFNTDEAAQMVKVEGKEIPVIEDNKQLEDLKAKSQYADAIYTAEKLIFVRAKDLDFKPANGSILEIGEDVYRVLTCTDYNGGLWYQIVLAANG